MTLMAIVPLLALGTAVARGLKADAALWTFLKEQLKEAPPAVQEAFDRIVQYVNQTNFSTLTALGLLLLLWTALSVFSRIERAFQEIWRVRRPRGGVRRYGNYLSVLLVAPLFVVAASAANAAITASPLVATLRESVPLLGGALRYAALLVPLLVEIGVFAALYRTLPATWVPWRSALAGGTVAGMLWLALQSLYFGLQIGAAKYNTIYGSLASLPLFLVYVYFAWCVLLFGAEFAHASERAPRATSLEEGSRREPPPSRAVLFAVMSAVTESFGAGRGAWVPPGGLRLPRDEIESAAEALVSAGLLARAESPEGYLPARPLESVTARDVAEAAARTRKGRVPGLPPPLEEILARADREAGETLARYTFAPTPPPPSSARDKRP